MVWQFLKTREEQNKILKVGIKDFVVVTNVLYVHMKRNAVMRTEFETKLEAINTVVKNAVLMAEKARLSGDKAATASARVETMLAKKG